MENLRKKTFSWLSPSLCVKDSGRYGKGVFAVEEIKKGDMLAVFGGYIMTAQEAELLPEEFRDASLQISEDFVIGSKESSEVEDTDYFNHSCNPNAGFKGQIFLVTIRDIASDEEVTFDYAMVLHRSPGTDVYNMECLCGKFECRGYITENDWMNEEIQKKYDGYFQWYLQEKIEKLKNNSI